MTPITHAEDTALTAATAGGSTPMSGAPEAADATVMRVKKRNGELETVDVNKIVRAVTRCCQGLSSVDAMKVATKTIGGLYDGATTKELDNLNIQTAALLIG